MADADRTTYVGSGYKHDIFVSYAHGVQPGNGKDSDLMIWTQALIDLLPSYVGDALRDNPKSLDVWHDRKLGGNQPLNTYLKEQVKESAILVIVMSRPYLTSEWCTNEINWFNEELERRQSGIENIFVVRARHTDTARWPAALREGNDSKVVGFPFFPTSDTSDPLPYGWVTPEDSDSKSQFYKRFGNLASQLASRLDEIRSETIANASAAEGISITETGSPVESGSKEDSDRSDISLGPVLVAPGTEDANPYVENVRTELKSEGCSVLPDECIRVEDFDQEQENKVFEEAALFVQCLGIAAGRSQNNSEGRVQQLDKHACEKSMPRFHWRLPFVDLNMLKQVDPSYCQFIEEVEPSHKEVKDLVARVMQELREHPREMKEDDQGSTYLQVSPEALNEFDNIRSQLFYEDVVLLPIRAPCPTTVDNQQKQRKARQKIYEKCDWVLMINTVNDQLDWLMSSIVDFYKDATVIGRKAAHTPVPIIIDSVSDAKELAEELGISYIRWNFDNDAKDLWKTIRALTHHS